VHNSARQVSDPTKDKRRSQDGILDIGGQKGGVVEGDWGIFLQIGNRTMCGYWRESTQAVWDLGKTAYLKLMNNKKALNRNSWSSKARSLALTLIAVMECRQRYRAQDKKDFG